MDVQITNHSPTRAQSGRIKPIVPGHVSTNQYYGHKEFLPQTATPIVLTVTHHARPSWSLDQLT
jgi:hypothetical protein